MNVEIPTEHMEFVRTIIARGDFRSESQVVGEALRLMEDRDRRVAALRQEVQVGLDQLDRGDYTEYDDEGLRQFFEEIKTQDTHLGRVRAPV